MRVFAKNYTIILHI